LLAIACLGSIGLATGQAAASRARSVTSIKELVSAIQTEVNQRVPSASKKGERTSCAHLVAPVKAGLTFSCITSTAAKAKVARSTVTMLSVKHSGWTWKIKVSPMSGGPPPGAAEVTYRVTAVDGTEALDITYNSGSGQVQLTLVALPFVVTTSHVGDPQIIAQNASSAPGTSISCELEVSGSAPVKSTTAGPDGVVDCG
jgi:hypothetical protein